MRKTRICAIQAIPSLEANDRAFVQKLGVSEQKTGHVYRKEATSLKIRGKGEEKENEGEQKHAVKPLELNSYMVDQPANGHSAEPAHE